MATIFPTKPLFSPRAESVVVRPSSTAILGIDSEDRFKSFAERRAATNVQGQNNPYDFVIQKNESIMNGFITRLGVTEAVLPWVVPNVGPKTNKINVLWSTGGATQSALITLPQGFYSPVELANAMLTAITSALPNGFTGLAFSYGSEPSASLPNSFSVPGFTYSTTVATSGYGFGFSPVTPNSATYPYGPECKQLFDLLGFSVLNTALSKAGIGQSTMCQAIRYVDIVCSQLTYNQPLKDTMSQAVARDTLCRLYITNGTEEYSQVGAVYTGASAPQPPTTNYEFFTPSGCRPFVVYRNFTLPKQISWTPDQPVPSGLRFQVYDDVGNLLTSSLSTADQNAPGGIDWSMTLLVSEN